MEGVEAPFSDDRNITVMAIDNLPGELPRDASEDFGNQLINNVLPHLLGDDNSHIVQKATITEKGSLTNYFSYLESYVK